MSDSCDKARRESCNCIERCLPKDGVAGSLLLIISTYSTLLAIVEQTSTNEASSDSDNQTIFDINEEYINVTISKISSPVLWNCRSYSMSRHSYRNIYITLVVITILWIAVGILKIPYACGKYFSKDSPEPEEEIGCDKCIKIHSFLQLLSNLFLRLSLIFMITSFDIDPWACIYGPSSIRYIEHIGEVDLSFQKSAEIYQVVGLVLALILGLVGWIIGAFVSEKDEDKNN